jgi:tRNA(Ile)-lysidine synthetase-like protein
VVIASILKILKFEVICVHINYKNRTESCAEAHFLQEWCVHNNIKFVLKNICFAKRGEINRNVYEKKTRQIRFDFYKKIIKESNGDSICLGHHDDDIIENIVSNISNGNDLTDLVVMSKESIIHDVPISRPLIGKRKQDVFHFAHTHKIPYFKDTTPCWSVRGKLRNQVLPAMRHTYHNLDMNLLKIAEQSKELQLLIEHFILLPFMSKITFEKNFVMIPLYSDVPFIFWKLVLKRIFWKYDLSQPSHKNIRQFYENMKTGKKTKIGKACSEIYVDEHKILLRITK